MVFFHVPDLDRPACADPIHLPLVDAAFKRPGGPAGDLMRERLCSTCPAFSQCLSEAMERGEWGIWAGTSPHTRTRHGGTRPKIRTRAA